MIERRFRLSHSLFRPRPCRLYCLVLAGALMEASWHTIAKALSPWPRPLSDQSPAVTAISTVLSCVFFGAISGSGLCHNCGCRHADDPGNDQTWLQYGIRCQATTATAGGIGIIIPPSIPMVIYGVTGQVSISKMFMAGFIPGFLIAFSLCVLHFLKCRRLGLGGENGLSGIFCTL